MYKLTKQSTRREGCAALRRVKIGVALTRVIANVMFLRNTMQIDISKATLKEKSLIENMMQLYLYDFSEFDGGDLDNHGLFCYKYLNLYWEKEDRTPLLIRVEGNLAGFVLVNKDSYISKENFSIAEFFIMRKYRGKSIGREVAFKVFDRFGPHWEVGQIKENTAAQTFWLKVVREYTNGIFTVYKEGYGGWKGPILTFGSNSQA